MAAADPIRTAHVGFTVRALDPAVAMFVDLFGYEVASLGPRHPKGLQRLTGVEGAEVMVAHLHHPDLLPIELIEYTAAAGEDARAHPCDSGFAHLTFDVRDLDVAVAAALRHGAVLTGKVVGSSRDGLTPPRVVYLRDPNGINLEFIQPA